ncbi:MAG: coproporphyrinogen dehydrogenase HemZ [Clostridiales bacterium]|nr:coproporphyrinogen dehydrogenase HemZ [Clostridiales bacterium]
MLICNMPEYTYEASLILDLFEGAADLPVSLTCREEGKTLLAEVTVGGRLFSFKETLSAEVPLLVKREKKRFYKLAVYHALKTVTGKQPPWGALTGIRPTKLAYMQEELGVEPLSFLQNKMDVSQEKTQVVAEIMRQQKGIYEKGDQNYNLFVSVPFCPTKCEYCSFISAEISKCQRFIQPYTQAVIREIEGVKPLLKQGKLRSVYIGGGTPVSLPKENLLRIMQAVGKVNCEYTVEAGRPDAITKENLQILKDFGVTRVCVNPQTFSDETLVRIGRKHTTAQTEQAFYWAREFGFDINMDFIAGLSGESAEEFLRGMERVCALAPENVTVHTLSLKKGSALKERVSRLTEGEVGQMVSGAYRILSEAGYFPYYLYRQKYMAGNLENVGFTKQGKACVYNVDIMEETAPIVACGANAVSKRVFNAENRIERYASPKDLPTYLQKTDKIILEKAEFFA